MKRFIILSVFVMIVAFYGCEGSEGESSDAGITTESTEKYFGFSDKKTVTYEGSQTVNNSTAPIAFELTMDIDDQTFSRKTFKVTWKSSIGIPFEEWFEIKNDSVYKVAQRYVENNVEKNITFSTPILFGKNPLKDGDNLKTETNGAVYNYIISSYTYKTYKNDFGEVKRIIASEGNASNEYYLKENEGFVGFKFNNHPALYTLEIEKKSN
ncbi:MAG: hypothetical protein N2746_12175 [Deltaproteobacteria bacterium]|nr:hypothetical protein [Deltaproteobacteria bacterium]